MDEIAQTNREIRRKLNRKLTRRVYQLSQRLKHAVFRRIMRADEAIDVAGLEVFDLGEPMHHIDLSRLRSPGTRLPLAILNQDVLARRFEPTVEHEFVVVLDLSRSMRYPLRRLYAGLPLGSLPPNDIEFGKCNLMKLIAGTFLVKAVESGFTIRIVTFGQDRIDEGQPLRRRGHVVGELFEMVDRRMLSLLEDPRPERSLYSEVLLRIEKWKGVFLFVGDFIDPVHEWHAPGGRTRAMAMLRLFRQWAMRRSVVVVRVNHDQEVGRPGAFDSTVINQQWGDKCDEQVESFDHDDDGVYEIARENAKDRRRRRIDQRQWQAVLESTLRSCCRGYLAVDNTIAGSRWAAASEKPHSRGQARLEHNLIKMWMQLVER